MSYDTPIPEGVHREHDPSRRIAVMLTREEIALVHEALQALSGLARTHYPEQGSHRDAIDDLLSLIEAGYL